MPVLNNVHVNNTHQESPQDSLLYSVKLNSFTFVKVLLLSSQTVFIKVC